MTRRMKKMEEKSRKNVIPDGVSAIRAFEYKNSDMEEIIIPSSVTIIEEGAFLGCNNLKRVVIPDSVTEMGKAAFKNCSSLNNTFPNNRTIELALWA